MDDFLGKMALNHKISKNLLLTISLVLILAISLATYWFFIRKQAEENIWHREEKQAYLQAELKNQAILLAFVEKACGGTSKENPCPDANDFPVLKDFALLEVIRNSESFLEFQYDDRFERELDNLPKFYLLNSSGEIRDLKDTFPDEKTLERWSKIK